MRILVLGGSGQLGAELIRQAPEIGMSAIGVDHDELEVTDTSSLWARIESARADAVINTTGYHVVPDCDRHPQLAFTTNATAVKEMAEACARGGFEFVTFSTDYVFDGEKGSPCLETDPPRPLQTYGVSKYAGELLAAVFHPGAIVIRTCGLYGGQTGSRAKNGNFVLSILRASETKSELEVSCEQIVNPTYAADLAAGTLGLLAARPAGGTYHLAAEGSCAWSEFAEAIVAITGRALRVVPVDHGARTGAMLRPRFSALGNERARAAGISLPGWRDGLERYLHRLGVASRRVPSL